MQYGKKVRADNALRKYDRIVADHFEQGGRVLVCSQDVSFIKAVRYSLEQAGVDYREHLREVDDYSKITPLANKFTKLSKGRLAVFLERRMAERSYIKPLKFLKGTHPDQARALVMTEEISREELILIHELGADSIITKPISANAIIEKLAFAIQPDNRLTKLISQAGRFLETGDTEKAMELADQVFAIKPDSLAGHMLLGDVAVKEKRFQDARQHYMDATKSENLFIKPLQKLVELCDLTGEHEEKLGYLKKLESLSPLNFDRKIEIGETYLELDDTLTANEYFTKASMVVKRVAGELVSESLMKIAKVLGPKDRDLALEYMDEAIAGQVGVLKSADLWMFIERGILLRQQGDWQRAIANYREALEICPDDAVVHFNMGMAYAVGKELAKAMVSFKKAMDKDPELVTRSPSIPFNVAMVYYQQGQRTNAKRMVEEALSLDRNYEPARRLLEKLN